MWLKAISLTVIERPSFKQVHTPKKKKEKRTSRSNGAEQMVEEHEFKPSKLQNHIFTILA